MAGSAPPHPGSSASKVEEAQWLVRAGFLARAIVYGVMAGVVFAMAAGAGVQPAAPSPQGALAAIVTAPLGRVALGVISIALVAYAIWKLNQGIRGRGPEGGGGPNLKDRLAALGGGVVYLVFFAVSIAVLTGKAGNGSGQAKTTTARVLELPGGALLVAIAGLALITISLYQAYDAIRGRFADDNKVEQMTLTRWRFFMAIGRVGLVCRSVIFAIAGYFLIRAAITLHAGTAVGVDGALGRIHREPFGSWLLALVGAGLATFTMFSALEARYRRL